MFSSKTFVYLYDKCVPGGVQSLEHVRNVLTNLVSGLQAEEIEVAEQVIVRRQKLQIQLGQSQTMFPCKCSDTQILDSAGQTQQTLHVSLQSILHATSHRTAYCSMDVWGPRTDLASSLGTTISEERQEARKCLFDDLRPQT